MRRVIANLIAPMLAAAMLLVSAGGVAADDQQFVYVDPYACTAGDGQGTTYDPAALPPGSEIVFLASWGTKTQGELQGFLNNVSWVMTVNGQAASFVSYSGFIRWGAGYWAEIAFFDGGSLASGEVVHTHYDAIVKSATFDGWTVYRQGSVFGGGVDCSFTAA